jgi:hypothetical protein
MDVTLSEGEVEPQLTIHGSALFDLARYLADGGDVCNSCIVIAAVLTLELSTNTVAEVGKGDIERSGESASVALSCL